MARSDASAQASFARWLSGDPTELGTLGGRDGRSLRGLVAAARTRLDGAPIQSPAADGQSEDQADRQDGAEDVERVADVLLGENAGDSSAGPSVRYEMVPSTARCAIRLTGPCGPFTSSRNAMRPSGATVGDRSSPAPSVMRTGGPSPRATPPSTTIESDHRSRPPARLELNTRRCMSRRRESTLAAPATAPSVSPCCTRQRTLAHPPALAGGRHRRVARDSL